MILIYHNPIYSNKFRIKWCEYDWKGLPPSNQFLHIYFHFYLLYQESVLKYIYVYIFFIFFFCNDKNFFNKYSLSLVKRRCMWNRTKIIIIIKLYTKRKIKVHTKQVFLIIYCFHYLSHTKLLRASSWSSEQWRDFI